MRSRVFPCLSSSVPVRAVFVLLMSAAWAVAAPGGLPSAAPQSAAVDPAKLAAVDREIADALAAKRMPGCVLAVGHHGKLVMLKAYGQRQLLPEPVAMTTDTVFDLASLTKPIATATSVMVLIEQGKIQLADPVARHIPAFAQNGKENVTILQLLTHQSGLIPDNSMKDYADGPAKAWERIWALKPTVPPGSKFIYSDVGYLVLGELVRKVSGQDVHQFSQKHLFHPLGMTETTYLPGEALRTRAAPTEKRDDRWIRGEVHDPRAHALGGIAGHAGLFSTAADLAIYAQMMIGQGSYRDTRALEPKTVALMTTPHQVSSGLRGLGWDMRTGYSSNRGQTFSPRAFGHGGFTGTVLWIDPELDLFVIFLSNRVHPDGKGLVNPLAGRIGTIVADALTDRPRAPAETIAAQPAPAHATPPSAASPTPAANGAAPRTETTGKPGVLTGIDVLKRDGFRPLQGRRVGLITNHTGVSREGTSTVELLHKAPGVNLVALFSPEHGFQGKLDEGNIRDTRDATTGLVVFSLYGKTRRPTAEMLRGIDTLVFDIQDIGARFYTYTSTMGYAMQVAAEHKLRFVVLDRPNPINGRDVGGPVLDPRKESFTAFHRMPVRHGMTIGELAHLFQNELQLKLDLHVVKVEGWQRGDFWDATGLTWINPSPNMRSLTEAIFYPGIGLLETTNLSVGRGTATPFEWIGAPWLDGKRLADDLNRAGLGGVRFETVEFTPDASVHANKLCRGIRLVLVDRQAFEPVRTGLEIAVRLNAWYPQTWEVAKYDRLLASAKVLEALRAGKTARQIEALWQDELNDFVARRAKHLLYP